MTLIFFIPLLALAVFGFLQVSVRSIGGRGYSLWYLSHGRFRRAGPLKLIYFRPKAFDTYSFSETVFFFVSFLVLLLGAILTALAATGTIPEIIGVIVMCSVLFFFMLWELVRVIVIDLTKREEEKRRFVIQREGERVETTAAELQKLLLGSYLYERSKRDENIEALNQKYLRYCRNVRKLKILSFRENGTAKFEIGGNA